MYSKMQDGSFIVCGYVARDAESKTTQNGSHFTKWSVKVGETTNEGKKVPVWTNCQAYDAAAKLAATIRKGDTVLAVGRIVPNEYNGKTYKNLVCEFVCIMQQAHTGKEAAPQQTPPELGDLSEFEEILSDGEVPF